MTRRRVDPAELDDADLLRRGIAAARVGESGEALALLTEAVRRTPEQADAWLWLASVEPDPQRKRDSFERVLALRPGDAEAEAGLARLAEKYGQALLRHEEEAVTRCAWHADREARLRCARCGRPICPECARPHPVGWRCPSCASELRSPLYKVGPAQVAAGLAAGVAVSVVAAVLVGAVSRLIFFGLLLAPAAGGFVADVVSRAAGRKRGRTLQAAAAAAVLLGPVIAFALFVVGPLAGLVPFWPLGGLLYALLGAAAAWYRLR